MRGLLRASLEGQGILWIRMKGSDAERPSTAADSCYRQLIGISVGLMDVVFGIVSSSCFAVFHLSMAIQSS